MANFDTLHLSCKGGGHAAASVLGGDIEVSFVGLSGVLPVLKSGTIAPLAVASDARSPALPEFPTMAEVVIKGFEAVSSRYQMLGPAGRPEPVLSKLHASVIEVVHAPDTHQRFSALGMEPYTSSRADHAVYIAAPIEFWKKIAHADGMSPQ